MIALVGVIILLYCCVVLLLSMAFSQSRAIADTRAKLSRLQSDFHDHESGAFRLPPCRGGRGIQVVPEPDGHAALAQLMDGGTR